MGRLYECRVYFALRLNENKVTLQQAEKQISLEVLLSNAGVFLMFTALLRQQTHVYKLTKKVQKTLSF